MVDRPVLLMVAGYLVGLSLLAYELRPQSPQPPAETEQVAQSLPPLEIPPLTINNIAVYDAITERPLFTPDRRPDEVEVALVEDAATANEPVDEIDGYRLAAVLKGYGSMTALVEDPTGKTRTLHLGDRLGKWELQEILDDGVVIAADAQQKTLVVHTFEPVSTKPGTLRKPPAIIRNFVRRPTRPTQAPREPAD